MKYKDKTHEEWLDFLEKLMVDDVLVKLVSRLFPEAQFSFAGESKIYENLVLVNKPPKSTFEDELINYKGERILKLKSIFDLMAKKKLFKEKIASWKHFPVCVSVVTGEPNGQITLRELIEADDFTTLALIDTKDAELEAAFLAEKVQEGSVKAAKKRLKNLDISSISDPILKDILTVLRRK